MGKYWIHQGDVANVCASLPDNYFDGVLCDPPYGIKFMGKKWDYAVPQKEDWASVLRVIKPGAHLLACGGAKTYHRVACAIEDAGFEMRDQLQWLYAKGFPKSLNVGKSMEKHFGAERHIIGSQTLTGNAAVSLKDKGGTYGVQVGTVAAKVVPITGPATDEAKAWDGYGTALKPGHEPIALARKRLDGTVVNNALKWGTGALAIDACRIGDEAHIINRFVDGAKPFGGGAGHDYKEHTVQGRWPANLLLDEEAGAILDAEVCRKEGPSRFFFSSKVSTKEREAGCESLALRSAGQVTDREDGSDGLNSPRAGACRTGGSRNGHPTLKPISLTTYLARMILPPPRVGGPPRRLLVPYCGAGSEMIGALLAGWDEVVGIELDPDNDGYIEIACLRIAHWTSEEALKAA